MDRQRISKNAAVVMQQQGHEQPRLTDAHGELLQLKLQNIHAGSDRKVSENTEHCSLYGTAQPQTNQRSHADSPFTAEGTKDGHVSNGICLITTAHVWPVSKHPSFQDLTNANILLADTTAHLQGQDCSVLYK